MIVPEDFRVEGQVAIVTGGGAGIGRGIALCLAAAGADIVIADVEPSRCEEVAERVRELGRRALPCPTNVTDPEQIAAMVAAAEAEFGRIDILVNNAGGVTRRAFLDSAPKSWGRLIDLNYLSMLHATHLVVPVIIKGGRGGSVINVSSIEGVRAAPRFAVYASLKAAMNSFTRSMALELSDHGIRVNAISPDYTDTPGTRGNYTGPVDPEKWAEHTPEHIEAMRRRIPLGKPGEPKDCGMAALYFASPMGRYVTGTILPVDGGSWASFGWARTDKGWWLADNA
jgi:NAD(P)-dependent dehydrogenase (short-subunit alcohol dehydrogenase family)